MTGEPLGRLPGSVWTGSYESVIRRIILGWSPTGICTVCGEGRRPIVESYYVPGASHVGTPSRPQGQIGKPVGGPSRHKTSDSGVTGRKRNQDMEQGRMLRFTNHVGYVCACPEPDALTTPAVILDPFGDLASGVAESLGRFAIMNHGSEL